MHIDANLPESAALLKRREQKCHRLNILSRTIINLSTSLTRQSKSGEI